MNASRRDERIIIHFDFDCFYASVFEAEDPSLRSLPLVVQQKHIIVTCNYEARRRGLHKLQLLSEVRRLCPDAVVVVGEDLTRFRNVSKALYDYLTAFTWSRRAEKLGFDEVFLDVTDMVAHNLQLMNPNDRGRSFFHMSREDPTIGFPYDGAVICGQTYPPGQSATIVGVEVASLFTRLALGSHLAQYMRHKLEEEKGYTSSVGISTSKLLSKLVGNCNKPKGQTTLAPPYTYASGDEESNVNRFLDGHEVRKIPGIGFKLSRKIRDYVLGAPADVGHEQVWETKERVSVRDARGHPGMSAGMLEEILGGPGAPQGIGKAVWGLLNGIDETEVGLARKVPRQISIEDSYLRLDKMEQVKTELVMLSKSLLNRMHTDLLEDDEQGDIDPSPEKGPRKGSKRWMAHPRTLRLTTRPRPPRNPDGSRARSNNRISRSGPIPQFIFSLTTPVDTTAEKLVQEALLPQFRKLHPERDGWDLSLVNVAATNIVEAATDERDGRAGADRDIMGMFKRQDSVLREWKVEDRDVPPERVIGDWAEAERTSERSSPPWRESDHVSSPHTNNQAEGHVPESTQDSVDVGAEAWQDDEEDTTPGAVCESCGAKVPLFAVTAHARYHLLGD
ncbi:MAG: hypothetical protein M1832_006350 [Thelocarpon impressellum]|nr:MAG: hypothetical protein M1832_006350 [Thelocarpon impressellum]